MIAAGRKPAQDKSMIILGIETSCDETGVAVYDTASPGAEGLRAQALYSQVALHAEGGQGEALDEDLHAEIRHVPPRVVQGVLQQGGQVRVDRVDQTDLLLQEP